LAQPHWAHPGFPDSRIQLRHRMTKSKSNPDGRCKPTDKLATQVDDRQNPYRKENDFENTVPDWAGLHFHNDKIV
jgi:hypothetical protein